MADEYLYKETVNPSDEINPLVEKNMYYILDQNGSSYNGQIMFDTSILANSGQWLAYSEAYIEIPFVMSLQSRQVVDGAIAPGDISAAYNAFTLGLKNGYHQIVDSIQVDYNNTNVIQLQPFTNFFVNYKLMTSMSADDLQKWGPSIGFWPDSAGSFSYANHVAAAGGDGYSNVADLSTVATFTAPENYNDGFLTRRRKTTAFNGYGGVPTTTAATASTIGKNTIQTNGAGAAQVISWVVLAQIRLKDVCDFFDKIPLVKGAFMRLTINYNSAFTNITAAAVATRNITAGGIVMNSGRTNPMLVGSSTANNSGAALNAAIFGGGNAEDRQFKISCGVAGNQITRANNVNPTLPMSQCRLYVPAYSMNSIYEAELITVQPHREIKYLDVYNYTFGSTTGGQSFNQILTNGIVNPKYVVVMPFAAPGPAAGANSLFLAVSVPTYQSPFDTAPSTTTPMAAITQFQVQVAGQNMLQQNFQYDFENFFNEVSAINAINGGASTGLTSGLIGQYEWDNAYRYYVCDISRRLPAEDNVPKSIVVQGTVNAPATVSFDFVCFVVFERKLTIDMRTGGIVP